MNAGLVRQSSYGSLNTRATPSMAPLKKSSSLSSIVSGTSEFGYSVAARSNATPGSGSSASSIKASMLGKRPNGAPAATAGSRQNGAAVLSPAAAAAAAAAGLSNGTEAAKRGAVDVGSLTRSLRGNSLLDACTSGDLASVRKVLEGSSSAMLQRPDVNNRDTQGKSALMLAVTSGSKALVEYLLAKKADVNAVDSTKKSALHHASKRARNRRTAQSFVGTDQSEVVTLLLQGRASLEAQDGNGCTPLMLAVANSDESVARSLLQAGANLNVADCEGQTSLDYAVSFELTAMAQLLRETEELRKRPPPPAPVAAAAVPAAAATAPAAVAAVSAAAAAATAPATAPAAAPAAVSAAAPSAVLTTSAPGPTAVSASMPTPVAASELEAPKERADEVDEAAAEAEEKARRKAEKKKKKHAKEAEAAEAATAEETARREADDRAAARESQDKARQEAENKARQEAEQQAAEEEKRRAKEEAKRAAEEAKKAEEARKAEEAKRAAEDLARQEAEERERLLGRLQALMKSSSDVVAEAEAEEVLKELKAAIKEAQAAGVEEQKVQEAEGFMKDLKSRGKAQEKLRQAMAERDLDKLWKAIAKAEEANVPKSCIDEAKAVVAEEEPKQRAREQLQAAREHGVLEELRAALAAARQAKLGGDELAPFEQLQASLEQREQAEAALKQAIESRGIDALKAAIQRGTEVSADSKLIKQAEKVLKEEEPKQKARGLLKEACEQCAIPALKEAIQAAEAAGLDAAEYSQASELLRREEEKMQALEAVNKALEDVKAVDMGDIDALREAKDKLTGAIQEATQAGLGEAHLLEAEKRRKKLHNGIEDLKGSIRVFCRIRPLSKKEKEQGDENITKSEGSMGLAVEGNGTFQFDAVFTPGTQEEVFEDCRDLVQSAVDGYNVTMFAYGQTGAGKTFTMYGAPGMEGTAPRTIQEIYRVIEEGKKRFDYMVMGSMLELYRNDLVDLLSKGQVGAKNSKLNIRTDKAGMVVVDGLTDEECKSVEELSGLLERGNEQRTVACTAMNAESSRSHLVLMIKIRSINKETKEQLQGKILICDLAGSERLKKSQVTEEGQKEAIEINKSLTALGDVIEALTKGAKIIPYRNHKLTQLMQDSLGGTSKTLMFVNCSPASSNVDETVMSLKYATRAKKITNTAKKG